MSNIRELSRIYETFFRSMIAGLRNKSSVDAETFDSVTVLFSDIPAFGAISMIVPPIQSFQLLHDAYLNIDYILELFDVYKVETINDSYMVRTWCSNRNWSVA